MRSTPGKPGATNLDPKGVAREHERLSTPTLLGHSVGVLASADMLSVGRSDPRLLSGDRFAVFLVRFRRFMNLNVLFTNYDKYEATNWDK